MRLLARTGLIADCSTLSPTTKDAPMITHSVFFKLKHPAGSEAEAVFLTKAANLAAIPGVINFQRLEETSPKNPFSFGLSMEFENQAAYEAYNTHSDHVDFVQQCWLKEVTDFQEIDHVPYSN
jgi:quinol monooxygenase YgiN